MAQQQAADRERNELVERNEQLEAEVEKLKAQGQQRGERDTIAEKRVEQAERRASDAEVKFAEAERKLHDVARHFANAENEAQDLKRRLAETEERALQGSPALKKQVQDGEAKLVAARDELDQVRQRMKQLEMERRLVDELEVPKLRGRVQELESDLRAAKAAAAAAPVATGVDPDQMRGMFRELLKEVSVGAPAGADASVLKNEFAKLQQSIASQLAQAGGRGPGEITEADFEAAKVSIEALFKHDTAAQVQSNIADVKVKEQTTTSDLKSKMSKLKALRKGGSTE
jgi:hypothetical protein